jgi:cobalamin transport system substrate-binding protein
MKCRWEGMPCKSATAPQRLAQEIWRKSGLPNDAQFHCANPPRGREYCSFPEPETSSGFFMRRFIGVLVVFFCAVPLCAKKYVSLMPSYSEILFALSAEEIVGVSDFCDFPSKTEKIAKVGDYLNPNIELIYSLKPDVVFTGKWKNNKTAKRLRRLGIKVVEILPAQSIDDIYRDIKIIGSYTDLNERADVLIKKMKGQISALEKKKSERKDKPKVFIYLDSGNWTAGGDSFLSEVVEKSGGVNVFGDLKKEYMQVSWESISDRNPDVIIVLSAVAPDFSKIVGSQNVNAVKNKRIFVLDRNVLSRPSPGIVEGIQTLIGIFNDDKK